MKNLQGQSLRTSSVSPAIQMNAQESGKTPTFEMIAYTGDKIRQGFYPHPIVVELSGLNIPDRAIPIDAGHFSKDGVGHTDTARLEGEGAEQVLKATGIVSRDTEAAREIITSSGNGFPWQASIEASILSYEEVKAGVEIKVNGRDFQGPLLVVRKSQLDRISFVDLGADSNTTASVAASMESGTQPNGGHQMDQTDNDGATNSGQVQTPTPPAKTPPAEPIKASAIDDLENLRTSAKLDAQRQSKINATAKRAVEARPDMADTIIDRSIAAIESGVAPSDFELEMMRFSRDIPGVGSPRRDRSVGSDVIEAALCQSGGLSEEQLKASFSDETLNRADMSFKTGLGLCDAILVAARERGFSGLSVRQDLSGALRAAFADGMGIQAGASSIDLPNVFSNVANKFLLSGYNAVDNSWESVADIGSARDFKQLTSIAFGGDYIMKKLAPSGEIEHGEPGETVFTNQADTFARMLQVNRQQLINDDLGALTAIPRRIGRGGAMAFNNDFWTKFEANGSFFTTGNGSKLSAGAGTALSIDSFDDAYTAFMSQTDPDDNILGVKPGILLVPTALAATAHQIVNSTEVRGSTGTFGISNPHAGKVKIVVSPYLTSATAWYLLANPSDLPVIQSVFLNGRRRPEVETADATFSVPGIQMRGIFDFGNALQDYRGGVMSPGA